MADEIKCPKCKSQQVHAGNKGFSTGKAIAGTIIAGPLVGGLAGVSGSSNVKLTCLSCGHEFKPGEHDKQPSINLQENTCAPKSEATYTYQCCNCQKISTLNVYNKNCPKCGYRLSDREICINRSESHTGVIVVVVLVIIAAIITIIIL